MFLPFQQSNKMPRTKDGWEIEGFDDRRKMRWLVHGIMTTIEKWKQIKNLENKHTPIRFQSDVLIMVAFYTHNISY